MGPARACGAKKQSNGYFCSKIEDRGAIEASRVSRSDAIEDREAMLSKHREAIEASRSDVIEDRGAIEASRRDAPGVSHRAIADAPPGLFQLTLTRQQFSLYG